MKNIILAITLFVIALFSLSVSADISNTEIEATPIPEIIPCESEGICVMTTLAILLQSDQAGEGEIKEIGTIKEPESTKKTEDEEVKKEAIAIK